MFLPKQLNTIQLEALSASRDNNYKLLRLLLCTCVVFTHAYMLLDGNMLGDPIKKIFHIGWGDLGYTTVFFLISGFTVSQNFIENNNLVYFIKGRVLRIFPAVLAANLFVVFVCLLLVRVNVWEYLFSKDVFYFLYRNTLLIFDIRPRLGFGIFDSNPYPKVINAQWWTLPWNLYLYGFVILVFGFFKKLRSPLYYNLFLLFIIATSLHPALQHSWASKLLPYFCTGAFFYINRQHIPLHSVYFIAALLIYIISFHSPAEPLMSPFLKGYMVFYLVYVPKGWLMKLNRFHDYSFGIFLYHLFVQQLLIHYGMSDKIQLFFASFGISVLLAMLSLHLVELPALRLKNKEISLRHVAFWSAQKNINRNV
jgi:peptidoglycan/LPS O-acetylase OafA/YrhL